MLSRLKRLFRSRTPSRREQLNALRRGLDFAPDEIPIADLFPLFTPASFFEIGNWPGPYELLRLPGLGLTWAVEQPKQTLLYVTRRTADYWDQAGIDWRKEAMQNLAKRSDPDLCTGHFRREGLANSTQAVVFMHPDGYGPSRLLFCVELLRIFPQGYLVALPEMSCGFALAADATPAERARIEALVQECFTRGTRPLIPGLHDPSLLVPR